MGSCRKPPINALGKPEPCNLRGSLHSEAPVGRAAPGPLRRALAISRTLAARDCNIVQPEDLDMCLWGAVD